MRFTGLLADLRFALRLRRRRLALLGHAGRPRWPSASPPAAPSSTWSTPRCCGRCRFPTRRASTACRTTPSARDGSQVRRSNRVLNFLAIREEARSFSQVVGMRSVEWSLLDGGTPVPVAVGLVSPGSFELLGVQPGARPAVHAGRGTGRARRERRGAQPLAVAAAVRRPARRRRPDHPGRGPDGRRSSACSAPGFRFPYDVEAWMPERVDPAIEASLAVFARLAPGVAPAQAQAELDAIAARAEAIRPVVNRGVGFAMTPIRESLVGDSARTSLALMAAAVLLLVLASANVANLLLARGIRRAKEIAVRAALGAERGAPGPADAGREPGLRGDSAPRSAWPSRIRSARCWSGWCRTRCAISSGSPTPRWTCGRRSSPRRSPPRPACWPACCRR